MLTHGLKEMDGQRILVPRTASHEPTKEYLEERYGRFRAAYDPSLPRVAGGGPSGPGVVPSAGLGPRLNARSPAVARGPRATGAA
jgi:hypothetical protein